MADKEIDLTSAHTVQHTPSDDAIVHLDTQLDTKKYATQNSLRFFYGYDAAYRNYGSSLSVEEEKKRSENLSYLINPELYESDQYTTWFRAGIRINNLVYRYTYQVFFLILSFTIGLVASLAMGLFTSLTEFWVAFLAKPILRLFRMIADLWTIVSNMAADILKPVAALALPWNKH